MKRDIYIVYNPETFEIRKRFSWFGEAQDYADVRGLRCINSTHPIHRELLTQLIERKEAI